MGFLEQPLSYKQDPFAKQSLFSFYSYMFQDKLKTLQTFEILDYK